MYVVDTNVCRHFVIPVTRRVRGYGILDSLKSM